MGELWPRIADGIELVRAGAPPLGIGPTSELAIVLGGRWRPETVFVIIRVHMDESGTHRDAQTLFMGGYVASVSRWEEIDKRWRKMLTKNGLLEPGFHTVDYWARDNAGRRVGPYRDWTDDQDAKFLARLQKIVSTYPMFGFTTELGKADFQKFYVGDEPLRKPRLDSEYGVCFRAALSFLLQYIPAFVQRTPRINIVLDRSQYFGEAERVFNDIKDNGPPEIVRALGTITPGRRPDFYGIQAADALITSAARHRRHLDFHELPKGVAAEAVIAEAAKWREVPIFRTGANAEVLAELKTSLLALKAAKHQAYLDRKAALNLSPPSPSGEGE